MKLEVSPSSQEHTLHKPKCQGIFVGHHWPLGAVGGKAARAPDQSSLRNGRVEG
jgi:hypothetical protein